MKHTPGPWGFGNTHEGQRLILGENGNDRYVCNVQIHQMPRYMGMMDEEEREANARLIKTAPDMKTGLRLALDLLRAIAWGKEKPSRNAIQTAIVSLEKVEAKAEGK